MNAVAKQAADRAEERRQTGLRFLAAVVAKVRPKVRTVKAYKEVEPLTDLHCSRWRAYTEIHGHLSVTADDGWIVIETVHAAPGRAASYDTVGWKWHVRTSDTRAATEEEAVATVAHYIVGRLLAPLSRLRFPHDYGNIPPA